MGKEESFTRIIRENEGVIFKITTIYTQNGQDQKDLYQEIVYQLWKGFNAFRGDSKASTWMYRISLNTALLHLKKKKRRGHNVSLDGVEIAQENDDPILEERLKVLYEKIRHLGEMDRGIIFLFLEGKKYDEIAVIMGLSASNVGTRMARIKEKLKAQIIKN